MKKKLFGAIASFIASALLAGPVYNPASSAQFESGLFTGAQADYTVRVGYVGDYVMDRKLKDKVSSEHINESKITRNGVSLTLGLFNRFDVYAVAGSAQMSTFQAITGEYSDINMATSPGSFWTLGARGTVWSMDNTTINAFCDYSTMKADVNSLNDYFYSVGHTNSVRKGKDWQVGLGISQTIQVAPDLAFIPALTVRYSDGRYTTSNNAIAGITTLNDLTARSHLGIGLNCGFYAGKMFALNFESRFVDESAMGVTLDIRI